MASFPVLQKVLQQSIAIHAATVPPIRPSIVNPAFIRMTQSHALEAIVTIKDDTAGHPSIFRRTAKLVELFFYSKYKYKSQYPNWCLGCKSEDLFNVYSTFCIYKRTSKRSTHRADIVVLSRVRKHVQLAFKLSRAIVCPGSHSWRAAREANPFLLTVALPWLAVVLGRFTRRAYWRTPGYSTAGFRRKPHRAGPMCDPHPSPRQDGSFVHRLVWHRRRHVSGRPRSPERRANRDRGVPSGESCRAQRDVAPAVA